MTTHLIRQDLKMSQKEFSERYSIPIGTIKNWDARGTMPSYMASIFAQIVTLQDLLSMEERTV